MNAAGAPTQRTLGSLILVPALISFAVTTVRLGGELFHANPLWFNPRPGFGISIVSAAWLPFIFGPYFLKRVEGANEELGSLPHPIEFFILAAVGMLAAAFGFVKAEAPLFRSRLAGYALLVVGMALVYPATRRIWRVLVAYGLAARAPEALVAFFALRYDWGTHWDAVIPGRQTLSGFWPNYLESALFSHMIFGLAYTVFAGLWSAALFTRQTRTRF